MPKHLCLACLLYIAALVGIAALAPLHEAGVARFITPMLASAFIAVAILFMRRTQWTWTYMRWIAFIEIAINLLFFPSAEFYGTYIAVARGIAVVQIVACTVMLWSLFRWEKTRLWFIGSAG